MTENLKKKFIVENSSEENSSLSNSNIEEKDSNTQNVDSNTSEEFVLSQPKKSAVKQTKNLAKKSIEDSPSNLISLPSTNEIFDSENNESTELSISDKDLETEFSKLNCKNENYYSNDCNKFLLKKEFLEGNFLSEHPEVDSYLYPSLSDKNFNIKIASKKEFNDTKYDGTIYEDIKKQADIIAKADFELQPHQAFVKNFLSFNTPYNSLLLYHGLGSGKTCSAIGVCEEMRDYMKQMGITKRIIIVASENVQDNFRLQLFDERKLKQVDGIWNIRACTGNKLLQEINPMNMKGIPGKK